ncbi:hypothetical protein TNCV_2822871 [Trichonephila clavipes]|nr:hypothetical protein TNCV_2822871 [Trichonephila clavipes]
MLQHPPTLIGSLQCGRKCICTKNSDEWGLIAKNLNQNTKSTEVESSKTPKNKKIQDLIIGWEGEEIMGQKRFYTRRLLKQEEAIINSIRCSDLLANKQTSNSNLTPWSTLKESFVVARQCLATHRS